MISNGINDDKGNYEVLFSAAQYCRELEKEHSRSKELLDSSSTFSLFKNAEFLDNIKTCRVKALMETNTRKKKITKKELGWNLFQFNRSRRPWLTFTC